MITAGIDIGSRNTKLVLWDTGERRILFSAYESTDVSPMRSVNGLLENAFSVTGLKDADIGSRVATGYGRNLYQTADRVMSEISCHANGVRYYYPGCRTVIDIGGQDSKIIVMNSAGKILDFAMNDKCAAGTGRFLEMTALRLGCSLSELADLALQATSCLELNSTCVVFAETEIIGLMSAGVSAANISMAVHRSIARRVHTQTGALEICEPVAFTGGVALNIAVTKCLGEALGTGLLVCPDPEITGALGAALTAGS
jgi:predicted CoA-substrate-specific enzyme activase